MGFILLIIAILTLANITYHVTALIIDKMKGHKNYGHSVLYSQAAQFFGILAGGAVAITCLALV